MAAEPYLLVRNNRVVNVIHWDGVAAYDVGEGQLIRAGSQPGVWAGYSYHGGSWVPAGTVAFPRVFPSGDGMLQVVSNHEHNGSAYLVGVNAKDLWVGRDQRASYTGSVVLPAAQNTSESWLLYLRQPASGDSQMIVKLRSDPDQPDPADCRLISAFGTYNYADDRANWRTRPMNFRQVGHDVFFHSDANIENRWRLPTVQQGWLPKDVSPWVPEGFCDLIRLRIEVGAQAQGTGDYFVQANIASTSAGHGSKEVKGRSPIVGNNMYVIDLIEVPLASSYIYCCGNNAIAGILCCGFRLSC